MRKFSRARQGKSRGHSPLHGRPRRGEEDATRRSVRVETGAPRTTAVNSIQKAKWGEADGREIGLYTLANRSSLVAKITNYGAIMVALDVPDRKGTMGVSRPSDGPVCRPRGDSRSIERIARTQSGRERRLVNRSRPWLAVDQTAPRQ